MQLRVLFLAMVLPSLAAHLSASPLDPFYVEVSSREFEADPRWIQFDTDRQCTACLVAATAPAAGGGESFQFVPPKTTKAKRNWCRELGTRLYDGHNQRFILSAVLKQLINDIYAHLSENQGQSDVGLWLSKHRWCIDAFKQVCF